MVIAVGLLITAAVLCQGCSDRPERKGPAGAPHFEFRKDGELAFVTVAGDTIATIHIEIADTPVSREVGLMYREELGGNQGMLFVFEAESIRSFWMRNTVLPLDMIFVTADYRIVTIHENTIPYTVRSYISDQPVLYVVEVNGGFCAERGVKLGDLISYQRDG